MKLCIVGPSGCGKDEAAEWFAAHTWLRYWGSCSKVILPFAAKALDMTEDEAFACRHARRSLWREIGDWLRKDDPAFLARETLKQGDILVGVRSLKELSAIRREKLVDIVVWIERTTPQVDDTLEFDEKEADVTVLNLSSLASYHRRLRVLANAMALNPTELPVVPWMHE
jgi:hypothetical protein